MAKKVKPVLKFVERLGVLYAVTGMPERTVAPKETGHYICYCGLNNRRYKMKINSVTFGAKLVLDENGEPKRKPRLWKATKKRLGNVELPEGELLFQKDKSNVVSAIPNFTELPKAPNLKALWDKCNPAFKRDFPI